MFFDVEEFKEADSQLLKYLEEGTSGIDSEYETAYRRSRADRSLYSLATPKSRNGQGELNIFL